jgi:hypothetical protein
MALTRGDDYLRGLDMATTINYSLFDRAKGSLSADEARLKQSVWAWFSRLNDAELDRVRAAAVYHQRGCTRSTDDTRGTRGAVVDRTACKRRPPTAQCCLRRTHATPTRHTAGGCATAHSRRRWRDAGTAHTRARARAPTALLACATDGALTPVRYTAAPPPLFVAQTFTVVDKPWVDFLLRLAKHEELSLARTPNNEGDGASSRRSAASLRPTVTPPLRHHPPPLTSCGTTTPRHRPPSSHTQACS